MLLNYLTVAVNGLYLLVIPISVSRANFYCTY